MAEYDDVSTGTGSTQTLGDGINDGFEGSSLQEGLTTEQWVGPRLASMVDIDLSEGWATLSFWREARQREFSLIMSTPNALGCI